MPAELKRKAELLRGDVDVMLAQPDGIDPVLAFSLVNMLFDLILRLVAGFQSKGDTPAELLALKAELDVVAAKVAAFKVTY